MTDPGVVWLAAALVVLALFPLITYLFFYFVVLERKSQGLINELNCVNAFELQPVKENLKGPDEIRQTMQIRYGYKKFTWPVLLLVFFYVIALSIVWDIMRHRFAVDETKLLLLYASKFLKAAELPMMSFIGVMVFNSGYMVRRLFVWDLTTAVFWNALQRTWLVLAVASVLAISTTFSSAAENGASDPVIHLHVVFFAIGFIVNEVLGSIMDRARERFKIKRMQVNELPLSLIQGINFWHENRLQEEGVENIQNLATCDFFDLAFATRYNIRTLLDWVDQAILIHRMGQKATKLRDEGFITGAIDLAWASPLNKKDAGDRIAAQIAETVQANVIYVTTLMNSLYQDTQVELLWDLWQSTLDSKSKEKNQI